MRCRGATPVGAKKKQSRRTVFSLAEREGYRSVSLRSFVHSLRKILRAFLRFIHYAEPLLLRKSQGSNPTQDKTSPQGLVLSWRRGRDSNPRYVLPHAGFQDRYHQPLGHLSSSALISDSRINRERLILPSYIVLPLKSTNS